MMNDIIDDFSYKPNVGYIIDLPTVVLPLNASNKLISEGLRDELFLIKDGLIYYEGRGGNEMICVSDRITGNKKFNIESKHGKLTPWHAGNLIILLLRDEKSEIIEVNLIDEKLIGELKFKFIREQTSWIFFPKMAKKNELIYCETDTLKNETNIEVLHTEKKYSIKESKQKGCWSLGEVSNKYIHIYRERNDTPNAPRSHKILDYQSLEVLWEFEDEKDFFTEEDQPFLQKNRPIGKRLCTGDGFLWEDLWVVTKSTGALAVDLKTGKIIWNITTGMDFLRGYSCYMFDPHRLEVFAYNHSNFIRINALTGEVLIRKSVIDQIKELTGASRSGVNHRPSQSKAHIFTLLYELQMIIAVNKETGNIDWHYKSDKGLYGSVHAMEHSLYIREGIHPDPEEGLVVTYLIDDQFDKSLMKGSD